MNAIRGCISEYLDAILSFGPRAIGSPGERATAEYIAQKMAELGLKVDRQEFLASFFPLFLASRMMATISIVFLLIIGKIFYQLPIIVPMLLIILLIQVPIISLAIFGTRFLTFGRGVRTKNIIGRLFCSQDKPTIVVVAHYDSKSQTTNMAVRVICFLVPVAVCVVLFFASVVLLGHWAVIPKTAVWILIALAVICLAFQFVSRTSNRSPGAIDNASGVAMLLALAGDLPQRLVGRANLVFLASGAEEAGLTGAVQYVLAYRGELDPQRTLIFNFDSLGTGGKVVMVSPRRLRKIEGNVLVRYGFSLRHLPLILGVGMDHMPFNRMGYRAMSFTQGSARSAWRMHSPEDRREFVNEDELVRLTAGMAEIIEKSCR